MNPKSVETIIKERKLGWLGRILHKIGSVMKMQRNKIKTQ